MQSTSNMATDVDLRDKIEAAIHPWSNSSNKPPFAAGELIVMALVLHNEALTLRSIMRWLATSFRYYDTLVFSSFWENLRYDNYSRAQRRATAKTADEFKKEFEKTLNSYEFPVAKLRDQTGEDRLSISIAAAQIHLAERFGVEPQGTFPFLDLPPEIRSIIYEMVASYPQSGLILESDGLNKIEIRADTRDFSTSFSMPSSQSPSSSLTVNPHQTIFSLLRASKQINEEFMSCFFNLNTFRFRGLSSLLLVSKRIPQFQTQHLRHIAFKYNLHEGHIATEAFKWIASLDGLQRLDIHMDEGEWRLNQYPSDTSIDLFRVAGVHTLRKIRGLKEVNFHGNCANAAAILKSEMELPAKPKKAVVQKRKAGAVSQGERKQPARAVKAAKTAGN